MLLLAPALGNGLILDDYYHREVAVHGQGYLGEARQPLDMFNFFPAEMRKVGLASGLWPWWMSRVKISFFRPLSSLTHWLDYSVWPDGGWQPHLHSLLWCGALILVVAALYRRTLAPAWTAGLATLLFALDGAHVVPAAWLASRNMLVAAVFGVLSIGWYVRAEEDGWSPGRWLSAAALLASLLGAELGVSTLAYLVAHAAVMSSKSKAQRALSLAPHLVIVAAWQIAYTRMGYGAEGVGLYTHPLHAPLAFLGDLATRAPVLLATQLTLPFAEYWLLAPVAWAAAIAVGTAAIFAGMVWLLLPQLRADRRQRWYALGALLAVVPACATFANGRMLVFVGIGGAPLLARLVERVLGNAAESRAKRVLTGALLVRHTAFAALMLPILAASPRTVQKLLHRAEISLPDGKPIAHQTLVVVRTPHTFLSSYVPVFRRTQRGAGRTAPARTRTLTATVDAVRIRRIDAHTLEIHVDGGLLGSRLHQIEWDPADKRAVGYHVDLGDMTVDVVAATADGRPETIRVRFQKALEDPGLCWSAWQGRGFAPFGPPPVGASVVLPPIDMLDVLRHLD